MEAYVARQPIFDTRHQVVGYELLHRSNGEAQAAGPGSLSSMSAQVMVEGVLGIGLEELTGGSLAYINFPREPLLGGAADVLDPGRVVIEIHETVEPDEAVVAACEDLVARGFSLAMDDFVLQARFAPLLELAEVVKIDVLETDLVTVDDMVEEMRPFGVTLLAEKVENEVMHEDCLALGFELFQGFHYYRPEVLTSRDFSSQSLSVLRLLNLLGDMNAPDAEIQAGFQADPSLTFKLLRMVNSAALGGRGVSSIGHALRILGREILYRWLSVLLLAEGGRRSGVRAEIVESSIFRGRMCEILAASARPTADAETASAGALFLTGLFSHLDTLFQVPMEDILARIDLVEGVGAALLERKGQAGAILSVVEAYEEAKWAEAEGRLESLGGNPAVLSRSYRSAVTWAARRMELHTTEQPPEISTRRQRTFAML